MTIPFLDAYLGFAFRNQSHVWPDLEARGLTLAAAKSAWEVRSASFLQPHGWTPESAIDLFGKPTLATDAVLAWDLVLWPEHQFWANLHQGQNVFLPDRLKLRTAPTHTRLPSHEIEIVRPALRLGWHCDDDVRALLGDPIVVEGWSPEYALYFGPLLEGTFLEITTQHGMATALRTVEHAGWLPLRHFQAPWWRRLWRRFLSRAV